MSPSVIPCYKIIPIKNSFCSQDDNFFGFQQIAINGYKELINNPHLIDKFKRLCEGFTFVNSWDDLEMTPKMFRIYARNVPAKEASRNFIYSVKRIHSKNNRNQRK